MWNLSPLPYPGTFCAALEMNPSGIALGPSIANPLAIAFSTSGSRMNSSSSRATFAGLAMAAPKPRLAAFVHAVGDTSAISNPCLVNAPASSPSCIYLGSSMTSLNTFFHAGWPRSSMMVSTFCFATFASYRSCSSWVCKWVNSYPSSPSFSALEAKNSPDSIIRL